MYQNQTEGRKTALVVDDTTVMRRGVAYLLSKSGYDVFAVPDGKCALQYLATQVPPTIVVTDLRMQYVNGDRVAQSASELAGVAAVVMMTSSELASVPAGVGAVLPKSEIQFERPEQTRRKLEETIAEAERHRNAA